MPKCEKVTDKASDEKVFPVPFPSVRKHGEKMKVFLEEYDRGRKPAPTSQAGYENLRTFFSLIST